MQGVIESGQLGEFLKIRKDFLSSYTQAFCKAFFAEFRITETTIDDELNKAYWKSAAFVLKSLLLQKNIGLLIKVDMPFLCHLAHQLSWKLMEDLGIDYGDIPAPGPGPGPTPVFSTVDVLGLGTTATASTASVSVSGSTPEITASGVGDNYKTSALSSIGTPSTTSVMGTNAEFNTSVTPAFKDIYSEVDTTTLNSSMDSGSTTIRDYNMSYVSGSERIKFSYVSGSTASGKSVLTGVGFTDGPVYVNMYDYVEGDETGDRVSVMNSASATTTVSDAKAKSVVTGYPNQSTASVLTGVPTMSVTSSGTASAPTITIIPDPTTVYAPSNDSNDSDSNSDSSNNDNPGIDPIDNPDPDDESAEN